MTEKQQKILFICLAIVIGSYFVRPAVNSVMSTINAVRHPPKREPPRQPPPPDPLAAEAAAFGNYSGSWTGHADMRGGTCNLGLELKQGIPGHYKAFSRFKCIKATDITNGNPLDIMRTHAMFNTEPDATVLTGNIEEGAIRFHTERYADVDNCPMSEMSITPFGTNAFIAEWKDCQEGKLLLQKGAR